MATATASTDATQSGPATRAGPAWPLRIRAAWPFGAHGGASQPGPSASCDEPAQGPFGCRLMLVVHGDQPGGDDVGVDEPGIEKRGDEILVLLSQRAQFGDAQDAPMTRQGLRGVLFQAGGRAGG